MPGEYKATDAVVPSAQRSILDVNEQLSMMNDQLSDSGPNSRLGPVDDCHHAFISKH